MGNMSGDKEHREAAIATGTENASRLRPGALRRLSISGRAPQSLSNPGKAYISDKEARGVQAGGTLLNDLLQQGRCL